jgi:tetrahydromethanopterin S-methyltransferase subunit D
VVHATTADCRAGDVERSVHSIVKTSAPSNTARATDVGQGSVQARRPQR